VYLKSRSMPFTLPAAHHVRRREPRYIATIPVTVMRYLRFGPSVTHGMSLDVSRSGMSVLVCGAPRVGETVVIALGSKTEPIEILATVRYSTDARSGFEFYPLSPLAEKTIDDWIKQLEQEDAMLLRSAWRFSEN